MGSLRGLVTAPVRVPLAVTGATLGLMGRPMGMAARLVDPQLGAAAREFADGVGREVGALVDPRRLRRQRRVVVHGDRVHAEVRGLRTSRGPEVGHQLRRHFEQVPGVDRIRINAATGRVTVAADPARVSPERVESILERVETRAGTDTRSWSRTQEHPSDREPVLTSALQLAGDVVGLGAALTGRVLPTPAPAQMFRAAVAIVDGQPRLRGLLEAQLGRHRTEAVITVANAVGQALDGEAAGLLADATLRTARLVEAAARFAQWRRWEGMIAESDQPDMVEYRAPQPRPAQRPRGPIERVADEVGGTSTLAAAATLAGGRGIGDAADAVVSGVPKAARAGRESFAAVLATSMSARGVLTLDSQLWRRLDRASAVIVDHRILRGARPVVLAAESTDRDWPTEQVWNAAQRLLPHEDSELPIPPPPGHRRRDLRLTVEPAAAGEEHAHGSLNEPSARPPAAAGVTPTTAEPGNARSSATASDSAISGTGRDVEEPAAQQVSSPSEVDPGDPHWCVLYERGRAVGRVLVGREPHPDAVGLLSCARRAGLRVVLVGGEDTGELRRSADEFVAATESYAELVRRLQRQGHVVAVVSGRVRRALSAADLGIGVVTRGPDGATVIPWQADAVCPDLACAGQILAAVGTARKVSERGRVLTLSAATLSGLLLASGPARSRPARATTPIAAATLLGLLGGLRSGRSAATAPAPARIALVPWHALEPDEVLGRLPAPDRRPSPPPPLLNAAVARLGERFAGPTATVVDLARQMRRELADPMTPLLAVGAVAAALLGSPTDAVLVGSVLGLNAAVSALQRRRAQLSLHRMLLGERLQARRITDDGEIATAADDLCPGDIIALRTGEVVPADARLLETDGLELDESGLTGESVTVEKQTAATPGAALADRSCMVFEGGVVVSGTARAVVVAVGDSTEAGRALAAAGPPPAGGVQAHLRTLTARVLPFTLGGGSAVTATSFLRGLPLRPALADGLAVAVAAVPEGLPLVSTVAQLAATRRLSRHGVLVRSSRTIDALGRVDTVCFDKTGTLTDGRLQVVALADLDEHWDAEQFVDSAQSRRLLRAAARACPGGSDGPPVHATDRAVVEAADARLGVRAAHEWDPIEEVPFESFRGYAAAVGHTAHHIRLAVKGAPEVLLPRCDQVLRADGQGGHRVSAFTDDARADAEAAVQRLAEQGLRVLLVARRDFPAAPDDVDGEIEHLTLLGFVGIADHPRPQTRELISELARNDIGIRMITGDHPVTARAVADQLGIPAETVATGADLDALDEDGRAELIERATVFARVSPEHKVRIVSALQRHRHTVAMVGDGSNDAAAIRTADVGIGLAARGSVAAREAADLILTRSDDGVDPSVLLQALAEGRSMWQRVRDAIGVLVGGNAGEVTFTVLGTLLSGQAPIGTRQFLVVNLLTDLGPAMAVALSRGRAETTDSGAPVLAEQADLGGAFLRAVAVRGGCTALGAGTAWLLGRATGRPRRAETMALAALIGTQLGQTLVIGHRSPLVWTTVAGSWMLLAGVIMTPGVNRFFGCVPLGPVGWSIVAGSTALGTAGAVVAGRVLT
ncbi:cation-translocating P-type ATPase [Nocardia blacklockiae]|uniref:cation-translocating P-type ATPase n=1 Tax=Nocardia blacklockiae TaxID=480036 RepID=UPI00189498A6|nr:cation-translocating P-type ATPase [Nocardia blacklockiae]MBF6175144.1 HAD-IC family P-type ATPase [Nocardia blacklockiae]